MKPKPHPLKPRPLERIQAIEMALRALATGDLHPLASRDDLATLQHIEVRLRALRHRLEARSELLSTGRAKPCP